MFEEERGGGGATGRRGRGEEEDADDEDPLPAEPVPEGARVQHAGGEEEGVRVDHPLQIRKGGVELLLNIGERDIDDGDVEQEHEDADTDDEKGAPFAVHAGNLRKKDSATLIRKVSDYGARATSSTPERSDEDG